MNSFDSCNCEANVLFDAPLVPCDFCSFHLNVLTTFPVQIHVSNFKCTFAQTTKFHLNSTIFFFTFYRCIVEYKANCTSESRMNQLNSSQTTQLQWKWDKNGYWPLASISCRPALNISTEINFFADFRYSSDSQAIDTLSLVWLLIILNSWGISSVNTILITSKTSEYTFRFGVLFDLWSNSPRDFSSAKTRLCLAATMCV